MSTENQIIFQQIRNSTNKLTYSGLNILIDPFLTPKGYYPGFEMAPTVEMKKIRIPVNDLPIPIEQILKDLDVRVVGINTPFKGITITKIPGQHGCEEMLSNPTLAEVSGDSMQFVLRAPGQKTFYVSGDTIWNELVELALNKYKPDIIVLNAPQGAYDGLKGSSVMGPEDVKKCYEFCKEAKIIPVHMNSLPHCLCTIEKMKKFVEENKMQDRVLVPEDGEILKF